jgi:hypothetical protein
MELRGKVVKEGFAKGSKSEREAIYLVMPTGKHMLRRSGANAFKDPVLEELVGKTIVASGIMQDYVFIISEWKEVPGD